MNTSKKVVRIIAELCYEKGIRKVVFSPGSRSAPLAIAFSKIPDIECIVIPDERVSGYFALGMAQQLREPVAVVCTSGTAVLNLAPAVCEAFYQQIPLLVLTADRPEDAVAKGDNQSIEQSNIMREFTYAVFNINGDAESQMDVNTIFNDLSSCFYYLEKSFPVRLNIKMDEPLYHMVENTETNTSILFKDEDNDMPETIAAERAQLSEQLINASKILIVVGSCAPNVGFKQSIKNLLLRNDVVVLAESISNCNIQGVLQNYESCFEIVTENQPEDFVPDVIITFGKHIVSKRLRTFFRRYKPGHHCDSYSRVKRNFFEMKEVNYNFITERDIIECLMESTDKGDGEFKLRWNLLLQQIENSAEAFISNIPFCDLKVFETLVKSFPNKANIQYGNSTPIRYSNLFPHKNTLTVNCNRGTSGIDGCFSTAAGAAYVNKSMTISVVGDITFFYDSNALWNNYLSPNLRIIIINNGGGNIFRWIDGAKEIKDFEKFFETKHHLTAKHLASMYDLPYYFCESKNEIDNILKTFFNSSDKPKILEIKTDGTLSAEVYKNYFTFLKEQN